MKKLLSVLAVLVLLTGTGAFQKPAEAMGTVPKYVCTYDYYGLRLRPEPNTSRREYCKIPHRTLLNIAAFSDDGLWGYTGYNGYEGWVSVKFLTDYDPGPVPSNAPGMVTAAPTAAPSSGGNLAEINSEYQAMMRNDMTGEMIVMCVRRGTKCNLRWGPSTSTTAIRTDVVYGETFTVLSVGNKWYQVYDEKSGRFGFLLISLTGIVSSDSAGY